jgi:DNA-binding NarL/FixJ family response regulator
MHAQVTTKIEQLKHELRMGTCTTQYIDKFTAELDDVINKINGTANEDTVKLVESLSPRERQIALYLKEGMSNKEIADASGLTVRTVKSHLNAVFSKLGVRDRLQAGLMLR